MTKILKAVHDDILDAITAFKLGEPKYALPAFLFKLLYK